MPVERVRTCPTAGDIELCYETFGPDTNEPLLLVMGLGVQMVGWRDHLCEQLVEEGFYVIRFDNRDVGLSSHLDQLGQPNIVGQVFKSWFGVSSAIPYSLRDMAEDAVALLDLLNIPKANLCGMSMGGMISQIIAIEWPDRVLSLTSVMSSTGNPQLPPASWGMRLMMLKAPGEDVEGRVQHSLALLERINGGHNWHADEVEVYVRAALERSPYRLGTPRQLAAILSTPDRTEALGGLTVPALVLHGRTDPLVLLAHGEATAAAIPGSELVIVDEMGHALPPEVWPQFISGVRRVATKAKDTPQHVTHTNSVSLKDDVPVKPLHPDDVDLDAGVKALKE